MEFTEMVYQNFGEGSDKEQADHINKLSDALFVAVRYDEDKFEGQLCYAAGKLDKAGRRMIRKLAAFIELDEKEHGG